MSQHDDEKESLIGLDHNGYGSTVDVGTLKARSKSKHKTKSPARKTRGGNTFRNSSALDVFLITTGAVFAAANGAGWPLMSLVFAGMTDTFIAAQNSNFSLMHNDFEQLGNNNTAFRPEQITVGEFTQAVNYYALLYVAIGVLILVASYVQTACWMSTCERQVNKLRQMFFKALIYKEIAWFDERSAGELTVKCSDDLERVREGTGDKVGVFIQNSACFLSGYVIAFTQNWKLSLVMMSLTPLLALTIAVLGRTMSVSARKEQKVYGVAGSIAQEVLSNVRTVLAFNGQHKEVERYQNALEEGKRFGIRRQFLSGVGLSAIFFILFSTYALAFWYGSVLISNGEVSAGTVFAVFFSVMAGSFSLGGAMPQIPLMATAWGLRKEIYDIIDAESTIDSSSLGGVKLQKCTGHVELNKVSFAYPSRKDITVLNNISITADPGKTIALVGRSGCGKSTIINLLLRFYDSRKGQVLVDGVDVKALNLNWLRKQIGLVSQEPVLFDATIKENIFYGQPNVSQEDIERACKIANAHSFIKKLPQGYNTLVGERGTQLSGGQKQRVAIARALVRDPKILLLDEATSALDAESERLVQEALDKAKLSRTTIIVAHRLSTIRNAHQIVVIDNGTVAETGTHQELMEKHGLYYELVNKQTFADDSSPDVVFENDKIDSDGTDIDQSSMKRQSSKSSLYRRQHTRSTLRSSTSSIGRDVDEVNGDKIEHSKSSVQKDRERLLQEMKEEQVAASNFKEILKSSRSEWCAMAMGMVCSAIRGAVMPAFAFFFSEIISLYGTAGPDLEQGGSFWPLMFVVVGIVNAVGALGSSYWFGLAAERYTMKLRLKIFRNLLRQDGAYFDDPRHATGKLCTRLASDAPSVKGAIDFRLSSVASAAISMTAGLALAFVYGWKMTLLIVALLPVIALASSINLKWRHSSMTKDVKQFEDAGKIAANALENVRTVQALTSENLFYAAFCKTLERPHKRNLRQCHVQALGYGFAQSSMFFLYAISFRFGAFLVTIGDMPAMSVFRVFYAISFSSMMIGFATAYFPEYAKAKLAASLIFKMMRQVPAIDSYSEDGVRPPIEGKLSFRNVKFQYPTRPEATVLHDVSFDILPGQTVALVGHSGCGKSTVVNLIQRLYEPSIGEILIDDINLRDINLGYLRSQISLVSQEPILFSNSISSNISYGVQGFVTHDEVVRAAQMANIHEFVTSLPMGYDTLVGDKGVQLSGGQKQRVAIARALVKNPKILILDEATSALDAESEQSVQDALSVARKNRTCIIIAHRLSTVQSADVIIVIKDGVIIERGSHNDLLSANGAYHQLVKNQQLTSI